MGNFDFLKDINDYEMFAASAIEAEKVYYSSPAMCAVGCRKAAELAVKWMYAIDVTLVMPEKDNLGSLIHEDSFKYALDEWTWKKLKLVSKLGNEAVHTDRAISAFLCSRPPILNPTIPASI